MAFGNRKSAQKRRTGKRFARCEESTAETQPPRIRRPRASGNISFFQEAKEDDIDPT